jgi:hypothetical protein
MSTGRMTRRASRMFTCAGMRRWGTDIPTILTCTIGTALRHDDRRSLRHRFRLKSS